MTGHGAPAAHVRAGADRPPDGAEAADAVLDRLPSLAGTTRQITELPGGLTNRNYRVTTGTGAEYVARFFARKGSLLAIDRDAEHQNSRAAARIGVGPEVIEYAPQDGVLLIKWINGRTFADRDLDSERELERLAAVCARLHAGPRFASEFDMFEAQRSYLHIVRTSGFRLPDGYLAYEPIVRRIEGVLRASARGTVPCHNDLLAANIIDDGERLWLVDYEYSGNNDPCFELGNIWSEAALDVDRLEHLVTAYFGAPSPVQTARARLFGLMAKYGWTLWAAIQDAVSDVDFDYWQWGMAKYVRACAEFRSRDLPNLITTVRESIRNEGAASWPTPSR